MVPTNNTRPATQLTPAEQFQLLRKEQLRVAGRTTTGDLYGFKR